MAITETKAIGSPTVQNRVHKSGDGADDYVIRVRNVGKMYKIYERPQDRLKQMLLWRFGRHYGQDFWALRDVSFSVGRGETIGIIGRNGSGKSTLLQLIAGTLTPTEGEVEVRGRVAALLELGSGFNPEFTGRENIFMNGAILGLSQKEMEQRYDAIAAFADIGAFLDQPVKLYSSGMYARLAFAIGIHIDPDVFIIDEALSVGDVFFQSRCVRKLDEYRERGGTVLFVTHDTYTVERICDRAVLISQGQKIFEGNTADVVNTYYQLERHGAMLSAPEPIDRPSTSFEAMPLRRDFTTGDGSAYIEEIAVTDLQGRPTSTFQVGEWMAVSASVRFHRDFPSFDFGIGLRDRTGVLIGGAHTFYNGQDLGSVRAGERRLLTARVQLNVAPNTYLLLAGIAKTYSLQHWEEYYALWDCLAVNVVGKPRFWGQAAMPYEIEG